MENLKKQLEELKTKVAELEKAIEEKENGVWKPELDENYYFINNAKEIMEYDWENDNIDYFNLEKRNVYKTGEEAQFALDMYNFCKERCFEPDWGNEEQGKYNFTLNHKERKIRIIVTELFHTPGVEMWYPYEECVQEIIDKYSFKELAKYYGRV